MQIRDDGSDGKLPLKSHRKVQHDADYYKGQCLQAVGGQLVAHLRADELGASQIGRRVSCLECGQYCFALLSGRATFLRRHANEHILSSAEILYLHILDAQGIDGTAYSG